MGGGGAGDRQILYATAFLRAVAIGLMGVRLGLYLARREFSAFTVGLVIGAGPRKLLVEIDVPTRQSYVMAVVQPHERTYACGITGLVRLGGWATGPFIAGALMQGVSLATPLFVGAAMKIGYDLMLGRSFRGLKPPEEQGAKG